MLFQEVHVALELTHLTDWNLQFSLFSVLPRYSQPGSSHLKNEIELSVNFQDRPLLCLVRLFFIILEEWHSIGSALRALPN